MTVKVGFAELQFPSEVYVEWLEAELLKASVNTTYDRLMSGGKKTLKEWANLLGKPIAVDVEGRLLWFPKKPEIGLATWIWYDEQFGCFGEYLPKTSSTIPETGRTPSPCRTDGRIDK